MLSLARRRLSVATTVSAIAAATWLGHPTTASAQTQLLHSTDFEYLGGFLLPPGEDFAYCKGVKAYRPDGDPSGPSDGYPGSLFGTGHVWYSRAYEVSIPAPVNSRNIADLPVATVLQAPVELVTQIELGSDDELKGLEYLPAQGLQTSGKLYVSFGRHYQYNRRETHGWTETTLTAPNAKGPWFVGPETMVNDLNTNEYIFKIPQSWSDQHIPGKGLACGRMRGGQEASGPAIIAFGPWSDGNPPAPSTELDAVPLLLYERLACLCASCEGGGNGGDCLEGHCEDDNWLGGAWFDTGTKSAVAIFGVKGYGDCWYGWADGTTPQDCSPNCEAQGYGGANRGYHSDYYETVMLLYDPDDLAAVAAGTLDADQPQPYETFVITPYMIQYPPSDPQAKIKAGASAYDAARGLLYITEEYGHVAGPYRPVVHVFRVGNAEPDTTAPGSIDDLGAAPAGEGAIELTWTAPGDDGDSGRAISYLVRRSTSSIDDTSDWAAATVVPGAPAPRPAGQPESMTVTGLSESTTYYFSVRARDDALNLGGLSNSPSATTVGDQTPPVLTAVGAVESAPGTVQFTWTTNEPADSRVEWDAAYSGSGPLANQIQDALLTTDHDLSQSGLPPGARVHYRVSSTDAAGNTRTDQIRFIDLELPDSTPPAIVFGPSVSVDSSATFAVVLWTTDEPAVGWVEWGTSPAYGQTTIATTEYAPTHSHRLNGLVNGQTIHFRVHVTDVSGNETVGDAETFAVAIDFEAPQVTGPVIVTTASQALFTFVADEPSFGTFSWGTDPDDLTSVLFLASYSHPAIMHTALIEGLISYTTYHWELSLVDLAGNARQVDGELLFLDGMETDAVPPSPPNGLYIANFSDDSGVALQWAPNSESDLSGYDVHRRPTTEGGNPTGDWVTVNDQVLADTAYLDDAIASEANYEYHIVARDISANESAPSESVQFDPAHWVSLRSLLGPARPNPFFLGSSTRLDFRVPAGIDATPVPAEIAVYDIVGRRVASLFEGLLAPGEIQTVNWNGRDRAGREVSSGIYFAHLRVADQSPVTQKITLLR